MLDFQARVHQTASRIKVGYTVRNASPHAAYLQNRYGAPRKCVTGLVGGGRSLNDTSARGAPYSTSSACVWPARDGTLLLFQGEVQPPSPLPSGEWSDPGFSFIGTEPKSFEIELGAPIHQWENNGTRPATGPVVRVRRLTLCIDVLLDPLVALEIDGAPGTFACDFGQPGYLEATVNLERPVDIVTDPSSTSRADAKLAGLKTLVRLSGWSVRTSK